jgi:hypothetical protein
MKNRAKGDKNGKLLVEGRFASMKVEDPYD